jgi:hypothetical protein
MVADMKNQSLVTTSDLNWIIGGTLKCISTQEPSLTPLGLVLAFHTLCVVLILLEDRQT